MPSAGPQAPAFEQSRTGGGGGHGFVSHPHLPGAVSTQTGLDVDPSGHFTT
jgi:hypothetical protein